MKKLAILLSVVLCVVIMLPLSVSAASWMIEENPVISVANVTPTIDGNIDANEGLSATGYLKEETAIGAYGTNPITGYVEFNFASTDEGLYFAVNVVELGSAYMVRFYDADGNTAYDAVYPDANAASYTCSEGGYPTTTPDGKEIQYYKIDANTVSCPVGVIPYSAFMGTYTGNSFQYSTGKDTIDNYAGFNGDTIGLSLDLLGAWEADGFLANSDKVPMYSFGLFQDGSVRVARSYYNDGEITEMCTTAGKATENGFCFEAMIPWDIIIDDQNEFGSVMGLSTEFTKENVLAEGSIHRASVTWQDRLYDEESEMVDTWSRYITVCETTAAGTPGYKGAGDPISCMGLKLQMTGSSVTNSVDTAAPAPTDDTTTAEEIVTETVAVTDAKGEVVTDADGKIVTEVVTKKVTSSTTKSATTGKTNTSNNSSAAQTFDAGIAVAIGTLATSALGVVYSKKRK